MINIQKMLRTLNTESTLRSDRRFFYTSREEIEA